MIKRENPSSVHMVAMSVVLSVPTPRVLIPVVHKKSQGPGKLAHVLCFQVEADPDFRQVRVQGPEPGREKAGSWRFSSRTEQGSSSAVIQAFLRTLLLSDWGAGLGLQRSIRPTSFSYRRGF